MEQLPSEILLFFKKSNQLWSAIVLAIFGNNCYTMIGLFFGCSLSGAFCGSSSGFGAFLRCFSLAR